MIYSIDAELVSHTLGFAANVRVLRANNTNICTSIPTKKKEEVAFLENQEAKISYFYGEFQYIFHVMFIREESIEGRRALLFNIVEVEILNNYRQEKREHVEIKTLLLTSKDMIYGVILDRSDSGLRVETDQPIRKKKCELHYVNENGESVCFKGKILWSKKNDEGKFQYGLKGK
ncbi:PilZ domain-containing protein (plasmid) [Pontibacillus sp. ALD_SL1]|uniref:PilZ domain-containing protein n=1 Tax=Pontibacillus sp. ALD_SL1 TaxID=2777185 RepID=UPI001A963CAB|nr:PilZ domain-containing protein [Pontibacillus sp. ALD_SL1]QST02327.1 PilZ domain-containing protein [Pontibacillus sp. ALD_SL1]